MQYLCLFYDIRWASSSTQRAAALAFPLSLSKQFVSYTLASTFVFSTPYFSKSPRPKKKNTQSAQTPKTPSLPLHLHRHRPLSYHHRAPFPLTLVLRARPKGETARVEGVAHALPLRQQRPQARVAPFLGRHRPPEQVFNEGLDQGQGLCGPFLHHLVARLPEDVEMRAGQVGGEGAGLFG